MANAGWYFSTAPLFMFADYFVKVLLKSFIKYTYLLKNNGGRYDSCNVYLSLKVLD
jgi:hypothetical protein